MGADDPLLPHPQIADVEVEHVALVAPQVTTCRSLRTRTEVGKVAADVLEDDVGCVAQDLPHPLREAAGLGEPGPLLLGDSPPRRIIPANSVRSM